jgi:hypothetical protein
MPIVGSTECAGEKQGGGVERAQRVEDVGWRSEESVDA